MSAQHKAFSQLIVASAGSATIIAITVNLLLWGPFVAVKQLACLSLESVCGARLAERPEKNFVRSTESNLGDQSDKDEKESYLL